MMQMKPEFRPEGGFARPEKGRIRSDDGNFRRSPVNLALASG
jgi:hypothetical protein